MNIFDYNGKAINRESGFIENLAFDYAFDAQSNTNYTIIRVNKNRSDGIAQIPFVRSPARQTALDLVGTEPWQLVLNAGSGSGLVIENSVVITDTAQQTAQQTLVGTMPLTIDSNGNLGYVEADTTGKGATYVSQGIVSAVCGFYPIIEDYDDFDYPTNIPGTDTETWQYAQRQVIGQFGNGDYAIITSEGRNFDNSTGFTITDLQRICKAIGLKFAYNLDGGGSTQTVLGRRHINGIYETSESPYGRPVKSFIVFNGTSTFAIPT